jgi:hypothetical protein
MGNCESPLLSELDGDRARNLPSDIGFTIEIYRLAFEFIPKARVAKFQLAEFPLIHLLVGINHVD